ncbi:Phosphate-binding protein pstS precursor [Slackia heliotrinireducens]|uniref:Phosphate-binding protein n=1 Tax=Slackia heliotrinireducens (strain ATCC 29202 / DSM 20476 / NCTC 11029 / RHS 1) TaxID=471855 RepID=C7N468_SLAHD|nr:phosphate ABC transporter substrate-binding protein [Slackia heliotrinireducens]ACV23804.1 phosphate-binding protein [Slackia heliotrinireducens DSM 20476]VEH03481.1 Phosphate-binding protein pstS precursor [Slackia heliotrinireducens]
MKFKNIVRAAGCMAAVAALACSMVACGGSGAEGGADGASGELSGTIATNGSTSMEKVIGTLAEQFMADNPGVTITYDATGSGTGIECAKNGSADIGLASRDLKDEETGLETVTVALDGIVVIVNEGCGVDDLSLEQIAAIFNGEITNWKEVGGADLAISCIGRESGSGTRDGFESITGTEDTCKLEQELTSTGAVITAVSSSENAIGYASLSSVEGQQGIKAVTVDGVACTEETVADGSYKIQRPFNFVLMEGATPSPAAEAFIEFATSPEAADLVRSADAIPAS